jgi:predicted nucleotidyltransferase/uncharacterized protein (UPF0332 family)
MDEEQLRELEACCTPLEEELGPFLKAIIVYGSAARKEQVAGSDIDLLIILDDTHTDFDDEIYDAAKRLSRQIEEDAPDQYDLHIQPPKPLSSWWDLLISGEPWAVTSMQDAQPIYDPSGYVTLTKRLLDEGAMHGTSERARRLLKRSRGKVKETRLLLLEEVTAELLNAMTESAQAVLMYYGHPPPSPSHVAEELETNFVEEKALLAPQAVDDYRAFYELTERIDHGKLTEFTAQELDRYLNQAMAFVKAMATLFEKLEQEKHADIVSTSHEQAVSLCREALEEHGVEVPMDDEATIERFKKEFIDEGRVSDEYWKLLQQITENKTALEDGELDEKSDAEIYDSRAHLRDFESAVQDVLQQESTPAFLADGHEEEPADAESVDIIKGYCDEVLDEYDDVVKAIWLLTVQELEETDAVTIVILFDDTVAHDVTFHDFQDTVRTMTDQFEHDKDIDVHPTFYALSDYWNLVRHGSPVTFSEIREGIPVYDPTGFFLPLKKLLKAGKIPGTKEAMRSLLSAAPKRAMKVKKTYKAQILEQLYNAVVDAGQAALLVHGVSPPVQKKLAAELALHLVADGIIHQADVDRCDNVITLWKDYEHGDIDTLSGEELDDAMEDAVKFIEAVEDVLDSAESV